MACTFVDLKDLLGQHSPLNMHQSGSLSSDTLRHILPRTPYIVSIAITIPFLKDLLGYCAVRYQNLLSRIQVEREDQIG